MRKLIFLLLLFCSSSVTGQQIRPIDDLQNYINNALPEKVYVHMDKDIYAAGENLWAAVYLLNGVSHAPGTLSNVVYLEIRDHLDNALYERKVYAEDGHGAVDFRLGGDLVAGAYTLVAYTNYQLNGPAEFLFRKTFSIIDGLEPNEVDFNKKRNPNKLRVRTKENIQFFPEGGDCINGVPCQVGVVADANVAKNGVIKNAIGKDVGKLILDENGVGRFIYLPESSQSFSLHIPGVPEVALPPALNDGYHLSVKKQKDKLRITVSSNPDESIKGARVVLHVRGDAILDQTLEKNESTGVIYLPYDQLPSGVNTITVFDNRNEPLAERLYFVPAKSDTELIISLEKPKMGRRKDVNMSFQAPLNAAFNDSLNVSRISLSVLPESLFEDKSSNDIRTWVLLNSDLDKHIDLDPSLLFSDNPRATLRKIDDFLMTRAWRRFEWRTDVGDSAYQPTYPLERGLYVQGYLTKLDSPRKRQSGKVFLTNMGAGFFEETISDDDGNFVFGPYLAYDTAMAVVQGRYSKRSDNNRDAITIEDKAFVDIYINDRAIPDLEIMEKVQSQSDAEEAIVQSYKEISDKYLSVAQAYDSLSITLDEVVFSSTFKTKVEKERDARAAIMGMKNPNSRLVIDSLGYRVDGQTIFDLIRNIPGFTVRGIPGQEEILSRGNNSLTGSSSPLLVVDGLPTDYAFMRNYPAVNVEFIDVIRGARAAAKFGIDATNGAIIVYTRNGSEAVLTKKAAYGLANIQIRGFYKSRTFATFDPNGVGNQNRPDIRTTLYWNPDIRTDIKGMAGDTFTTSDQDGKYVIIAQGIRSDGIPLSGISKFEVDGSLQ